MADLFERAARLKFRFPSTRGELTTEQLFDLPLTSRTGFDLDTTARAINTAFKAEGEESFVSTTPSAARGILADQLEIVKAIIARKMEAAARTAATAERADQRRKLLDALAAKDDQELTSASREDILKKLEALDA